jgi:N-acetyl sugar amidotransferase
MQQYPRFRNIDLEEFTSDGGMVKYGLPEKIQFCASCVVSNQRPNSTIEFKNNAAEKKSTIQIDGDGVCDACHAAHQKNNVIDWEERENQLRVLCDKFRRTDGEYDCVVPGSGGKDSFFAAHKLKYKYGMHPLTVTWAPHIYTEWGWHNFEAWIDAGFDNILVTPNGRVHRLLTRLAVENLYHPFQPFVIGQKAIAAKMSTLHGIPLVFYGENEAEYGNPLGDNKSSQRSADYHSMENTYDVFLSGVHINDLKNHLGVEMNDLLPYLPASPGDLEKTGTEVHYLGYYLKWHPQTCYYYSTEHSDFVPSPERTPGTYSKYNSIDDRLDDIHYYTTYIKFGIGRATYDAAQEIRSGDILREEGVALIKRYDGEFPERFIEELFEYLSLPEKEFPIASKMFEQPVMDRDYFMHLADRFRSPHIWKWDNSEWTLRRQVFSE